MEFFFIITGVLLFGEALAFYIGIFIVQKGIATWNTKVNRLYLWSDSISGIIIALNYLLFNNFMFNLVMILFVSISVSTHFKRITEYLLKKNNPFCANKALFAVNNLKLILLFGTLFLVLPF